jgi:hypothetical protein
LISERDREGQGTGDDSKGAKVGIGLGRTEIPKKKQSNEAKKLVHYVVAMNTREGGSVLQIR